MKYLLLVAILVMAAQSVIASHWQPPIGIPTPTFGIEESHTIYAGQRYEAGGFDYRDAGNGPYTHYVDNTVSCTDTNNPYGTQANPRCTIPWLVPAGSVVEVHGAQHQPGAMRYNFTGLGSSSQPVFFRGIGRPRIQDRQGIVAGQYVIVEGFIFDNSGLARSQLELRGHHISIRDNEVRNQLYVNQGGGCAICIGYTTDNVIYNNHIHHNVWAPSATEEHDVHGIQVPANAARIWIVDNEIDHSGGDSVQVNSRCINNPPRCPDGPMARFIYIARNEMHHDTENAVDIKAAEDVIISQNTAYGYVPVTFVSSGSDGTAIVVNDDNIFNSLNNRIWVIYNDIHSSNHAIRTQAYAYIIGNKMHGITDSAMVDFGTHDMWFEHNTLYDVLTAVWRGGGGTGSELFMKNNLVQQRGSGIDLSIGSSVGTPSEITGNMFQSPARLEWSGTTYNGLAAFLSATGKCTDCLEGSAMLADPANDNYNLQQGSPAIDKVSGSSVYTAFQSLYGISIAYDFQGVPRPQGGSWDIGAYEFTPSGSDVWPPSITGGSPSGTIGATTNVTLRVSTGEAAMCRYSSTRGASYDSMQLSMDAINGGLVHSARIEGLQPGQHNYSVRCTDGINSNTADYPISFTIFPFPDCTLGAPASVSSNTDFNITWNSTGAIHAAYRTTGNRLVQANGTLWPAESDLFYLVTLTAPARISGTAGSTVFSVCFDQGAINGTYDQCLARTPNKICSKTIMIAGNAQAKEGDVNGDDNVNIVDIQAIVSHWGKISAYPSNIDLSSPGVIDLFDVMVVVRNWNS